MRHRLPAFLLLAIVSFLPAIGCNGSSGPTSPITTAPPAGNGTVTGTIVASAGNIPGPSTTGASVRAMGTTAVATVDDSQSFTLSNVPANSNVVLVFAGSGLNTQVPIGVLNFADNIVLVFSRTNNTIVLDRTVRRAPDGTDIAGRIDSVSITNRSFIVLGQTIKTDAATTFLRSDGTAGSFFDLFVGLGVRTTNVTITNGLGAVLAKTVRLEDIGSGATVVLQGTVSNFSSSGLDFQFIVQGRLVKGNSSTTFDNGFTFLALRDGVPVEVAGIARIGFIQATQIRVR